MGYLNEFLYYNSGNESPERFWRWSALSLLGHLAGRKVWYMHGKFQIHTPLYVGLIGDAASGKSSAKSEVKNLIMGHFPDQMISASIQSREHIAMQMGLESCQQTWKNKKTKIIESFRPFYIIANEFENFLSVDTKNMVGFLVDIFDEKYFSTGFKRDADVKGFVQSFENPHVSILACGTPDWLMRELKMSLFTGGLGRRLILVADKKTVAIPDPFPPKDYEISKARVIEHLQQVRHEDCHGEFIRTESGRKWWHDWYPKHMAAPPEDPILFQFWGSEHVMMIKIAMLAALSENPNLLEIGEDHFAFAQAMLADLKPSIQRLTAGIGRNELAGIGTQMLDLIMRVGGAISEKKLNIHFARYMRDPEFIEQVNHYLKTEQLMAMTLEENGVNRKIFMLPDYYQQYVTKQVVLKKLPEVLDPIKVSIPKPSTPTDDGHDVSP